MYKPIRVFAFLAIILTILTFVAFLLPKEGVSINTYKIKYPTLASLIGAGEVSHTSHYTLDEGIMELGSMVDTISDHLVIADSLELPFQQPDSLLADSIATSFEVEREVTHINLTADILKERLVPIEMPDSGFSALLPFFKALKSGEVSRSQVRIMHYGDSQIEGDRITSFLRARLQTRFGGGGVGLLNAVPHSYQPAAVYQVNSSNWHFISLSEMGRGGVGQRFGVMGGYSKFADNTKDRGGYAEAWIDIEKRGSHSSLARNYTHCRLIYGQVDEPVMLSMTYEGNTQEADFLTPTQSIESISWSIPQSARRVRLTFRGDESPMIYALSLETSRGIVVDNLPIRGSSGVDFTRSDDASLKRMMHLLNPRLIILQFGVNIVPHIVDSYAYYENQLYQQIIALKKAAPNTSIILIGVSDVAHKVNEKFESYPNIELIRNAQRNAAFRGGAAFWDCYKAMGSQNSMPAWVFASPPLATKDFIHFTPRGSRVVAEMFYSSLMALYDDYVKEEER